MSSFLLLFLLILLLNIAGFAHSYMVVDLVVATVVYVDGIVAVAVINVFVGFMSSNIVSF